MNLYKYIISFVAIFILIWFSFDIYNFIITYHILVYLLLLILPTSSLIKKSLTISIILFINFFWAIVLFSVLNLLPYSNVLLIILKTSTLVKYIILY